MRLVLRAIGVGLLLVACGPKGPSGNLSAPGAETGRAQLNVHYPVAPGHTLTVHCGEAPGIAWNAPIAATGSDADVWQVSLDLSQPVQCKPVYDDQTWALGPNWPLAPGQLLDIWPHFFHAAGRVEVLASWHSAILDNDRSIRIYYPPSYDENVRERFPVVYMHDGQNLFSDATSFSGVSWNIAGAMDQGANDGSIHEAIVVGVDNTSARISEYTPVADPQNGGGNGGAYLAFLTTELKPQIDLDLRTLPDTAHTAVMGSSLGGLISLYAGLKRPDVYGGVAALSPSTWWDGDWIIGASQAAAGPLPARVYLDSGDSGDSNDDVTDTAQLAQVWGGKPGVQLSYHVQAGASHSETWWRQRAPGALAFLLGGR